MNARRRELPLNERLRLVEDLASAGQEATVILRGGQTYHEPDHSYSIAPPLSRGQRSRRCLASAKHLLLRWPREIGGAMEYEWSGSWYVCPPRRMTVASWPAEARSSTSLSRSLRGSSRRLAFIGRSHRSELAREYRRPSGLASGTVICRTSVVARSNRPA